MRNIWALSLAACTGGAGPGTSTCDTGCDDWQPVSYVDVGDVCFEASGSDIAVMVTVADCLSSSCSRNVEGTCTASAMGTDVTLTSDIHWEQNLGTVPCTDDCGTPRASCTLSGLADGTYTVAFGAEQLDLVVPVTEPCAMY